MTQTRVKFGPDNRALDMSETELNENLADKSDKFEPESEQDITRDMKLERPNYRR